MEKHDPLVRHGIERHANLPRGISEKALNMAGVVDVHAKGRGLLAEARHSHDVAGDDDEDPRAGGWANSADLERPSPRRTGASLVVAQAELSLRDADREAFQPRLPQPLQVVQRRRVVLQ